MVDRRVIRVNVQSPISCSATGIESEISPVHSTSVASGQYDDAMSDMSIVGYQERMMAAIRAPVSAAIVR